MSATITIAMTYEDAQELYTLLLTRPHNEEWSNRVIEPLQWIHDHVKDTPPPPTLTLVP